MRLKGFIYLSRIPFLIPGLAPFTAGLILGWKLGGSIDLELVLLGYSGLILIMLSTYYSNEYFDYEGDVLNKNFNKFSGGSRALSDGLLPRRYGLYALITSLLVFSILFTIYIIKYYHERPLLAYMSVAGLISGVFYSAPPFKWAYRGVGELLIAACYGFLAVTSGYYISRGTIDLNAILLSIPSALTVFSVIVINEVPDYEADIMVSKKNLVVRLGREFARRIYVASNVGTIIAAGIAAWKIGSLIAGIFALGLTMLLILKPTLGALYDKVFYDFRGRLEQVCLATIIVNALSPFIVVTSAYITTVHI